MSSPLIGWLALVSIASTTTSTTSPPQRFDESRRKAEASRRKAEMFGTSGESRREAAMFGTSDESRREAEMFGTSDESRREAEMFGTSDESRREAEMFGTSDESRREAAMFGTSDESRREAEMFGTSDESRREAEMFGGTRTSSAAPPALEGRRRSVLPTDRRGPTARTSGSSSGLVERLTDQVDALDDTLAIGGAMWLQLQATVFDEGSLADSALSSPNLVDIFLDTRPSDRLRAFVQGRLNYDPTGGTAVFGGVGGTPSATQVQLDQLWLRFDIARTVFVTAGKQRIRWGSGRLWNPTDFLNQQRLNPISLFDIRLGVPLVKLHMPVESLGWNFYAVANLDEASTLRRVGGAIRAELLLGNTELSVSAALRDGDAQRFGADFTAAVWDFDVRIEFALVHGDRTPRLPPFQDEALAIIDPTSPDYNPLVPAREVAILYVPEAESRQDDWIPQLVAGAEIAINYSDEDSAIIGLEYFYNDAGYDDEAVYARLLLAGRGFNPLDVGRHYLGLFVSLIGPGSWDRTSLVLSGIANMSDLSGVVRADLSFQLLTYLSWRVFANAFWGRGAFSPRIEIDPRVQVLAATDNGEALPVVFDRVPASADLAAQLEQVFVSGAGDLSLTGALPLVQFGTALVIDL